MTITLDTSDPRAAKKALAAALKIQKKQETIARANSDRARLQAMARGYRILCAKVEGTLDNWDRFDPHTKYFQAVVHNIGDDGRMVSVKTTEGSAQICLYALDLISVLTDGSGGVAVVFLREQTCNLNVHEYLGDPDGKVVAYALGTCGDSYFLADLPGILVDDFKPRAN